MLLNKSICVLSEGLNSDTVTGREVLDSDTVIGREILDSDTVTGSKGFGYVCKLLASSVKGFKVTQNFKI